MVPKIVWTPILRLRTLSQVVGGGGALLASRREYAHVSFFWFRRLRGVLREVLEAPGECMDAMVQGDSTRFSHFSAARHYKSTSDVHVLTFAFGFSSRSPSQ